METYGDEGENTASSSQQHSALAMSLRSPPQTTHERLLKLFRKSPQPPKKSSQPPKKADVKPLEKRLTIIDCDSDILTVPKEKAKIKLREEKRMAQLELCERDTSEIIKEKIRHLFEHYNQHDIEFLSATKSNDLFRLTLPSNWSACSVFDAYGSKPIYVRRIRTTDQMSVSTSTSVSAPRQIQQVRPVLATVISKGISQHL